VEHRFKPGNPGGPGRQRKTAAYRELEKMTKAQVQDALERLLSASVDRALQILKKGGDAEAARIFLSLVDRSVGPVPSASYINANVNSGTEPERIDAAQVNKALQQWQIAKGLLPQADVVENNSSG
jgi:hypothetical protein